MAKVDERLVLNRRFPQLLLAGRGIGPEAAELRHGYVGRRDTAAVP